MKNNLCVLLILLLSSCETKTKDPAESQSENFNQQEVAGSSAEEVVEDENNKVIFKTKGKEIEYNLYVSPQYKNKIPINTIINKEHEENTVDRTNLVLVTADWYLIQFLGMWGIFISTHNYKGEQLDEKRIIEFIDYGDDETHNFYILSPKDIRVEHLKYKFEEKNGELRVLEDEIVSEQYEHFQIDTSGKISQVKSPKTVIDFFCILPDKYFNVFKTVMSLYDGSSTLDLDNFDNDLWVNDIQNGYIKIAQISFEMTMLSTSQPMNPVFRINFDDDAPCNPCNNHILQYDSTGFIDLQSKDLAVF